MCNVPDILRFDTAHSLVHIMAINETVHSGGWYDIVLHTVAADGLDLLKFVLVECSGIRAACCNDRSLLDIALRVSDGHIFYFGVQVKWPIRYLTYTFGAYRFEIMKTIVFDGRIQNLVLRHRK